VARLVAALLVGLTASCAPPASPAAPPPSAPPVLSPPPRVSWPTAWPALPTTPSEARALVDQKTRRTPAPEGSVPVEDALVRSAEAGTLIAGWDAVAQAIDARLRPGHPGFVLVGTFHDAPAQIVAFRRLFGVLGVRVSDVTLEQFHADGHWAGAGDQRGDSALLAGFAESGDRRSLDALVEAQRDHDHAAWKYDYLEEIPTLVATLRTSGVSVHACDMPTALQKRAAPVGDEALLRLRELHCVLSLKAGPRVAMLWGADHVRADGIQRFLPPEADIVRVEVVGGRPSDDTLPLRLTSPLLVPVEGRFVLVLPVGRLAAGVDRSKTDRGSGPPGQLAVTAFAELNLVVGGKKLHVPGTASLPAGTHAFLATPPQGPRIAGSLEMPTDGSVELDFESAEMVRVVTHR
jgi:hypothetical protein